MRKILFFNFISFYELMIPKDGEPFNLMQATMNLSSKGNKGIAMSRSKIFYCIYSLTRATYVH